MQLPKAGPNPEMRLSPIRRCALAAALFFLAFFTLYLKGLSPAFHPDDSPETITAGATLSHQHPPGYPLHTQLGYLAAKVIPGSPAFGVNLLSAFQAALGLLLLAALLGRLRAFAGLAPPPLGAYFIAPAVLGLSYTFWLQAEIAKGGVYTLNFLLSQAALFSLALASRRGLYLFALSLGLAFANHWTSQAAFLPGYLALGLWSWRRQGQPWGELRHASLWLTALGFFAIGFSLYLTMPLRAQQHPPMIWSRVSSAQDFWWLFSRGQYAGVEASKGWASFLTLLGQMGRDLKLEFHGVGLAILALGWGLLIRQRWGLSLALLAAPLALALAVARQANPPADSLFIIDPYLVPLYSGLALGLLGFESLPSHWLKWGRRLLVLGAISLGLWHWNLARQDRHYLGYDYVQNLFLSCPRQAIVFCEGDSNTAGPVFQREVLNKRRDLVPVAMVLLDYDWYLDELRHRHPDIQWPPKPLGIVQDLEYISRHNPGRVKIATNSHTKALFDASRLKARGLVYRYVDKGGPASVAELERDRIFEAYVLRGVFNPALPQDPISVRLVSENYLEAPARLADAFISLKRLDLAEREYLRLAPLRWPWAAPLIQAGNMAYQQGSLSRAGLHWLKALEAEPRSPEALTNVGLYYLNMGQSDKALSFARQALAVRPGMDAALRLQEQAAQLAAGGAATLVQSVNAGLQAASRGDQLAAQGKKQEALDVYGEAIRLGYDTAGVRRNRAVMLRDLGRAQEGLSELERAVQLEPKDQTLHKYLAIFYLEASRTDEAIVQLDLAMRTGPHDEQVAQLLRQARQKK